MYLEVGQGQAERGGGARWRSEMTGRVRAGGTVATVGWVGCVAGEGGGESKFRALHSGPQSGDALAQYRMLLDLDYSKNTCNQLPASCASRPREGLARVRAGEWEIAGSNTQPRDFGCLALLSRRRRRRHRRLRRHRRPIRRLDGEWNEKIDE
jgi:hypothetical protein